MEGGLEVGVQDGSHHGRQQTGVVPRSRAKSAARPLNSVTRMIGHRNQPSTLKDEPLSLSTRCQMWR